MNNKTIEAIIPGIIHTACNAELSDDTEVKRQALADISDAIASIVPVEGKRREAEEQSIDALAKIEARLRVFNKSNLYPEQVKWLDETRQIAKDAVGRDGCPQPSADPQGFAKFLTVGEGVQLVRFHGKDEIKLVARRKGRQGNPNTIFEIVVDKASRVASVMRDDEILFEVKGVSAGYNRIETIACSALHSYLKYTRNRNRRTRRALKRRQDEKNMEG